MSTHKRGCVVCFLLTVVGAKEIEEGILSLRGRHGAQLGAGSVAEVLGALRSVAEERALELNAETLGLVQEAEEEEDNGGGGELSA